MKNKILITINNLEDIKDLKELGIVNYCFPLKDFCVGMPNTFLISEIPEDLLNNSYLFINRVLDNAGIDKLKDILNNIPKIKGIIFDDLGILSIIKDMKFEKILYLSHFNLNYLSVKEFLNYVDTVILGTDITYFEIEEILKYNPNISIFYFGYISSMYSRRLLIDNYAKFYNLPKTNPLIIENTQHEFLVYENEYGTTFYYNEIFNGYELNGLPFKYFFVNMAFIDIAALKKFLNGEDIGSTHFLHKETIYKLKEEE